MKNTFSYRQTIYQKQDIENYIDTININIDNDYINFEEILEFEKVKDYIPNFAKDYTSKSEYTLREPDVYDKLKIVFNEYEKLLDFIKMHYIPENEIIKDSPLLINEVTSKISDFSIVPKINKKQKKWELPSLFSNDFKLDNESEDSEDTIKEATIRETKATVNQKDLQEIFDTKKENVLEYDIIIDKIKSYNEDSKINITKPNVIPAFLLKDCKNNCECQYVK